MSMIQYVISRPVGTLMLCLGLMVLGSISLRVMPVSLLPALEVPVIRIDFEGMALDARSMEEDQIGPLRRYLSTLHHLDDYYSTSFNSHGWIMLRFDFHTNMDLMLAEVREKIDIFYHGKNSRKPRATKGSLSNLPMLMLNVKSKAEGKLELTDIANYCERFLKRRLEQFEGVAFADITGVPRKQINIIAYPPALMNAGITVHDLVGQMERKNSTLRIRIRDGNYYHTLVIEDPSVDLDELPVWKVQCPGGRSVPLGDLVKIKTTIETPAYYYNGIPAIGIAVLASSSGSCKSLRKDIDELIHELRTTEPELNIQVSGDRSSYIHNAVSGLRNSLLLGIGLSAGLMFLSIGRIKPAMILLISIPVSLLIAFMAMKAAGSGLNITTISGLILAVGLMVDNAIIVMDNIEREIVIRGDIMRSVVAGTEEVIRPLVSSQLTTCIVFLPLVFISDTAGALFKEQAIAIACGLASSFLVSVCVIPNLVMLFYSSHDVHGRPPSLPLAGLYEHILMRCLRKPLPLMFILLTLSLAGICILPFIHRQMFPDLPDKSRLIRLKGEGMTGFAADSLVSTLHQHLVGSDSYSCLVGIQGFLRVEDTPAEDDEIYIFAEFKDAVSSADRAQSLKKEIRDLFPALSCDVSSVPHPFTRVFGKSTDQYRETRIYSHDPSMMPHSDSVESLLTGSGYPEGHECLSRLHSEIGPRTMLTPHTEKHLLYGITPSSLLSAISLNGPGLGSGIKIGKNELPVVFFESHHEGIPIDQMVIHAPGQYPVRVGEIFTLAESYDFKVIRADRFGPYFHLPGSRYSMDHAKGNDLSEPLALKKGILLRHADSLSINRKVTDQLITSLIVCVLVLYFILAVQFGSVIQPFIILSEVIIDMSGSVVFLFLTGNTLNIMSLTGIIIMSGIIINDSILKLDAINRSYRSGKGISRSILEGGKKRFRPILLTSATTILALLPVLIMPGVGQALQKPLAASVIGGMATGTFVSLFLIPVAFNWEKVLLKKLQNISWHK